MTTVRESAALVALLRRGRRPWHQYAELVENAGSAVSTLEHDLAHPGRPAGHPDAQTSLLPEDPEPAIARAIDEIERWSADGIRLVTVLDSEYPDNLRRVHDRPPVIFVAGRLEPSDRRSVAVVGARRASPEGLERAREVSERLVGDGYAVASGLAAGIDTAAHTAALAAGGRTLAVVGTGLAHSYPPENATLQRRIATECAVISQFWPDSPPSRQSFPMRNAVMSGLSLGTVLVEASPTSGARIQARRALAHGRPVFLLEPLLSQPWARELATRPGAHVVASEAQICSAIERLNSSDALVA
jgi:DNA processing protein